jgi:GT2 family glycosyltransferase
MQWRRPYRSDGLEVAANFLPYAFGGNLGIRRAVWHAIGGFDPAWARGGTEIEFTWRAQLAGFSIGFAPGSVVAYRLPTTDRELFEKIFISAKGHPRLYRRFRDVGMPRPKVETAALDWAWILYHLPDSWKGSVPRIAWARRLAWRAGLAAGSVQWRTWYL